MGSPVSRRGGGGGLLSEIPRLKARVKSEWSSTSKGKTWPLCEQAAELQLSVLAENVEISGGVIQTANRQFQ